MMDVEGKKVLIVGLGASGLAAAELLAGKGAAVKITEASDTAEIRKNLDRLSRYSVRSEIGGHTREFCKDADLVVTSPGVDAGSLPLALAGESNIPVIGELELGAGFCPAPMIAVTGTNGKSTTTELIARILTVSGKHALACGNIGTPLSRVCGDLAGDSVAVVEVSSFQLETIKEFRPHIAVLLNISEDHYERHGGFDSYKAWKFRIFMNQGENDYSIVHSSFEGDTGLKGLKSKVICFGPGREGLIGNVIKESEVPLKGEHNLDNVAASILASRIMGIADPCIREGIMTFKGLPHRFESIGVFGGVEVIDDSKATNIDATRRALESVRGKVVLIAGGRDKGGDYTAVLPLVKDKVKAMVLIGEAREKITAVFSGAVAAYAAETMGEAVDRAFSLAGEGDVVMLSPMCSSFDMYSSYKERGDVFQAEVRRVVQRTTDDKGF
ncbi:MAG: UDP-N-acetylmuramoyl-L-alanine--D-glutamate ligase [Candidatus Omnitrophota bacterium]